MTLLAIDGMVAALSGVRRNATEGLILSVQEGDHRMVVKLLRDFTGTSAPPDLRTFRLRTNSCVGALTHV